MDVLHLFPTAVGIFQFERNFSKKELEFIKKQEVTKNVGNTTSTNRNILDSKELKFIKKFIEKSVQIYLAEIYNPKQNVSLRLTQSWSNYSTKNQWHHKHKHPNSFVSGVLYIQGEKDKDKIYFHKSNICHMRTLPKEWNTFNSESWWVEAYTGRLLIFPSELEHSVENVETEETRISLSFNTFPIGHFGDDESLTGLTL